MIVTLAATSLILGFVVWTFAGWRTLSQSAFGPLLRRRLIAALRGLAPCLALTLSAAYLPPVLTGLLSAVAFIAHCAADPEKSRFWHHRRISPLAVPATIALGAGLGFAPISSALIPLVFAAAVFHRHQCGTATLLGQLTDDLKGVQQKLATLSAERRQTLQVAAWQSQPQNGHDRHAKAG